MISKGGFGSLAKGVVEGLSLGMQFRRQKAAEKRIEQEGLLLEQQNQRAQERHDMQMRESQLKLDDLEKQAADSKTIEDAIKAASSPRMEAVTVGDPEAEGATFPGDPAPGRVEYRENDPRSPEKRMLDGLDAAWIKATQMGRADLAGKHFNEAAKMRHELRTKAMDEADQRFQATNDYSVYKDVYNEFVGDGRKINDIVPADDGTIAITWESSAGVETTNLSQEELGQMVSMMRDPKAMRALEMERAKEVFKHSLKMKEQAAKDEAAMERTRFSEGAATERTRMTQEGATERTKITDRGATRRSLIAQQGLNTRQDKALAADEAKSRRAAASTAKGGGEKDDYEYGSPRGVAKWQDDFETKYLPKTEAKTADGKPKIDAEGKPVMEVDKSLAGPMRQLAKMNKDAIQAQRVHPQEAAQAFQEVVGAFNQAKEKAKDPDQARNMVLEKLASEGRIKIARDKDGKPVKAVGVMGDGALFDLPENMSQEILIAEENRQRTKGERYDEREKGFVQRAEPPGWMAAQRKRPQQAGMAPEAEGGEEAVTPHSAPPGTNRQRLQELIRKGVNIFR